VLENYKIVFNKRSTGNVRIGFANIAPSTGDAVYGIGYKIDADRLRLLDLFEGAPEQYARENVNCYRVPLTGEEIGDAVTCVTYVAVASSIGLHLRPSASYMKHLLAASHLLPRRYGEFLRSIPTRPEDEAKCWYFAYGSNMSVEQLEVRVGLPFARVPARLRGYRWIPNKASPTDSRFGYANIQASVNDVVYGTANQLALEQLDTMDTFEVGYGRASAEIELLDVNFDAIGSVVATVYLSRETADGVLPSLQYMARILEGRDCLPPPYVEFLSAVKTTDQISPRQAAREAKLL
jgi:gamma-glutamylcyclotransferase (GGCT)/AIG2-like uncharacterized protein YtfP